MTKPNILIIFIDVSGIFINMSSVDRLIKEMRYLINARGIDMKDDELIDRITTIDKNKDAWFIDNIDDFMSYIDMDYAAHSMILDTIDSLMIESGLSHKWLHYLGDCNDKMKFGRIILGLNDIPELEKMLTKYRLRIGCLE